MPDDSTFACPVCLEKAELEDRRVHNNKMLYSIKCERCGEFMTGGRFNEFAGIEGRKPPQIEWQLGPRNSRNRGDLSAWIREGHSDRLALDETFFLDESRSSLLSRFNNARRQVRSFSDRANKLLIYLAKLSEHPGRVLNFKPEWMARAWAVNREEIVTIWEYLIDLKKLRRKGDWSFEISPEGWIYLDERETRIFDSDQGFMAMPFSDELDKIWNEGFNPGIENAGYRPYRVDGDPHNENIYFKIFSEIRKSRFLIADLTNQNPNVFLEAGFAMGLGIPVLYTCREDDAKNIPFDVKQIRQIRWKQDDPNALADGVSQMIQAVLGKGPVPTTET